MSMMSKICSAALIFLLAAGMVFAAAAPSSGKGGDKLDVATLKHMVTEAQGRVVVINFWASWCGPCRKEFPALEKLRAAVPENDLFLIGISLDFDGDMYKQFVQRQEFGYPVFLGDARLMDDLRIDAIPKTLIYDPQGKLPQNHDGPIGFAELHAEIQRLLARQSAEGENR